MNKYYVYQHVHPVTGELVYIGKGTGGRAWDVTRCRGTHRQHQEWMEAMMEEGYVPSDWVQIVNQALPEKEAFALEKECLHDSGGTIFNRQSGQRNYQAKLTDDQAREIYLSDEPVRVLAQRYKVSRACIYHIKKGTQWRAATAFIRN